MISEKVSSCAGFLRSFFFRFSLWFLLLIPVSGFAVVANPKSAASVDTLHLSIESGPGGSGVPIDTLILPIMIIQDTLYAVLRNNTGEFVSEAIVSWSIGYGSIIEFVAPSDTVGNKCIVTHFGCASLPGVQLLCAKPQTGGIRSDTVVAKRMFFCCKDSLRISSMGANAGTTAVNEQIVFAAWGKQGNCPWEHVPVAWAMSDGLVCAGGVPGGSAPNFLFQAMQAGEGWVTATFVQDSQPFLRDSMYLVVLPAPAIGNGISITNDESFRVSTSIQNGRVFCTISGLLPGIVEIKVYDPHGRLIRNESQKVRQAGSHRFSFPEIGWEQGVYVVVAKQGHAYAQRTLANIR